MELTLDQALQKGIEAHKAGKVQEADRYYTAILKANPKHPDANHNMGVLAVGVGKVEEGLPFFKAALEVNSSIAQYWLSYIDALIKLDRMADAKAVFDQSKSNGLQGDNFDKLEERLSKPSPIDDEKISDKILDKAIELRESGKYDEAINFLKNSINDFPAEPNIPSILSHCYILNDDLESAKIYLDAAKKINSDIPSIGWNEARFLLKQNIVSEALAVAKKTNKLFPNDVEGMGVLGSCLRANDNFDKGLKYLNKAIELNPNYAEAFINRGLISLTQNDKTNALNDLEKAYHLKPHIKQIWDLILNLKIEVKEYENAISIAEKMVKVDPVDEKTFAAIAICYQGLKNYDQAVVFYKKALSTKPDYAEAYYGISVVLKEQGKLEEAIEVCNKALVLKPDYAEAYYNMGNALKNQGKLEEAVEVYKRVLSIKPDHANAYINVGVALTEQHKLEEAIEAFNKALSIKPDHANAYYNMGIVLKGQGKLEESTEAFNKALSIKPDHAQAYNDMGNALHDQGKLEEAIEAHKKAISVKPNFAEAYNNMGNTLQDLGKLEEAMEAYKKALSLRPDYAEAYNNMGVTLTEQGNLKDAIEAYTKVISIKPDHAEANKNMGLAKLQTEEWKHGIKLRKWRWKTKPFRAYKRFFSAPEWDGEAPLDRKTLLIWGEQGPGDIINWCSSLDYFTSIAANVIIECQQKLVKLLTISFPKITVRAERKDTDKEDFDYHVPMETLFGYACLSGKISNHQDEYIFPNKTRVEYWKARLKLITEKPCIGISWKSPVMNTRRQNNYADLSFWKSLLQNENYTFFNLQSSHFEEDLQKISREFGVEVINLEELDHYGDLAEVAAFCKALDKSISVATTVAHISTAIGTETIIPTWKQGPWNNILFNSRGPKIKFIYRNTWDSWDQAFRNIRNILA